jgi:hypothetical protein
MQDAYNLAWKLALVSRGLCQPEPLLGSYSAERSSIAKLVLEATGKATSMAVLRGGIKQSIRDHVASLVLGFAPVKHVMANVLSEVAVGYSNSPLNAPTKHAQGGPEAGKRAPIRQDEPPVGSGKIPLFALYADPDSMPSGLLERYGGIVEAALRAPFHSGGLWLVRPDGYVALSTKAGSWDAVEAHLNHLRGVD